MNVSPPNMGILPPRIQASPPVKPQDDAPASKRWQDGSFGSILSAMPSHMPAEDELAAAFGELEHGVELQSGDRHYTLQVNIGDRAVAFDARPIVAPTSVAMAGKLPRPAPDRSLTGQGDVAPAAIERPIALAFDLRHATAPDDAIRTSPASVITANAPALRQTPLPIRASSNSVPPAVPGLGSGPGQPAQRPTRSDPHIGHVRQAEPPRRSAATDGRPLQAGAQLFAQLVAAAGEYRVSVRGTHLSRSDSEKLVADIRAALRSHGFADLPITLNATGGRG